MRGPTLTDLKLQLNYDPTDTTDDAELNFYLSAAIDLVEDLVGPLGARSVTETHYGLSTALLVLRQAPASAITSVTTRAYPGAASLTYLPVDMLLDSEAGLLRRVDGRRWSGDVTVTYTAGRTDIPDAVTLGTLIIAGHLWQTQRGNGPSAGVLQPDMPQSMPAGFAIPNRAATLLEPYRQKHVA